MKSRNHDEAVIEMLRKDPDFATEYLKVAFEEMDEDGGEAAFLMALRHIVEARGGMTQLAEKTGLSRESLYKALSGERSPGFDTILKVLGALGLKLHVQTSHP